MNPQSLSMVLSLVLFALIGPFWLNRSDDGDIVVPTIFVLIAAIAIGQFLANSGVLLALQQISVKEVVFQ